MKYVFKLSYYAPKGGGKKGEEIEVIETIVAETIQQALKYWKLNLNDEAIKFRYLVREEPVLTVIEETA